MTFYFLVESRGNIFNQVEPVRNRYSTYFVYKVCWKSQLPNCSSSNTRFRYLFYSTLPRQQLQYWNLLRHRNWEKSEVNYHIRTCRGVGWGMVHCFSRFLRIHPLRLSSAFKGKGKVASLKKLMKTPRFCALFRYSCLEICLLFCLFCKCVSSVS